MLIFTLTFSHYKETHFTQPLLIADCFFGGLGGVFRVDNNNDDDDDDVKATLLKID